MENFAESEKPVQVDKNKKKLVVVTFNLRKDSFTDRKNRWKYRKEYAMDVIKESGASIIGVQELLPKMKEDVKALLQGYTVLGWGRCKKIMNEHSDIILKDEDSTLSFVKTFWLSKKPESIGSRAYYALFPRICTVAEITLHELHQKIRVFNTHFDHICGPARMLGVKIILQYMEEYQKQEPLPVILMGDFNAHPTSTVIQKIRENTTIPLRDAFYEYTKGNPNLGGSNTLHFFKGKEKGMPIDYIFVSKDFQINEVSIQKVTYDGKYPSDHYPLLASLSLEAKGESNAPTL